MNVSLGSVFTQKQARTDFVEGLQVADGRRHAQVVWELVLQVSDQHPELRPPVSHVVQPAEGARESDRRPEAAKSRRCAKGVTASRPEDVIAQELEQPTHAVAYDGGAQVTHVHLFGDVGGGEVHHHLSNKYTFLLFTSCSAGGVEVV